MTAVLGLDPGISGALAIVAGDTLVVHDLPALRIGTKLSRQRRELDLGAVHKFLLEIAGAIDHAFIEKVNAMPGQGVTSMFRFGYACGGVHGVITALGVPITFVTPQAWQKAMGVGPGGDAARARAMALYPAHRDAFARKLDEHRADAALIATYGCNLVSQRLAGLAEPASATAA
jgi:crossover junction endodeoxyribonuclease RuvC